MGTWLGTFNVCGKYVTLVLVPVMPRDDDDDEATAKPREPAFLILSWSSVSQNRAYIFGKNRVSEMTAEFRIKAIHNSITLCWE